MLALAKYLQDTGVPGDARSAVDWLQKATDMGDPRAMVALAKEFSLVTGVAISVDRAKTLLEEAAAMGSNEAQKLLANMS